MGESGESNRFEVELTSHDGSAGWSRPEPGAPEADADVAGAAPPQVLESSSIGRAAPPEWGRIAGIAAIAVAALVLGWLLGRSGDSNDTSSAEPVSSSEDVADTTPAVSEAIAPVESVDATPETDAATTQTTIPGAAPTTVPRSIDEATITQVALDPAVKGMPTEIVGLASGRRIIYLDLSTGTLDTQVIDAQPFGPPTLFVGDDWLLLPSWDDDLQSTLLRDGSDPESVDIGPVPQLLNARATGELWRSELAPVGFEAVRAEQIDVDGTPLGPTLDLPAIPGVADPAGGLVVAADGGVYQVTPDRVAQITAGRLVALGRDHAIAHECDEVLVCEYLFIERATGAKSPLPLDPRLGEQPFFDTTWGAVSVSAFAPDGSHVAVEWAGIESGFRRVLVVLDVRSGTALELGAAPESVQYAWSSDGQVLFHLLGGRLSALDVATGESAPVSDDLFGVETFALRPLDP